MKQRTMTGAIIVATIILVLIARQLSTYIFDAFILLLALEATYEITNILAKMGCYNNKYFACAYPFFAYGLYILGLMTSMQWYMLLLIELLLIIVFFVVLAFMGIIFSRRTKNEIETRNLKIKVERFSMYKTIHTMFAYFYPALLMMFFIAINNLSNMSYLLNVPVEHLSLIAFFAIILTFTIPIFTDTFAYLTGMLFKGPKLCPKISPNKTISGALGGVSWGIIGSLAIFLIFNAIAEYNEAFVYVGFEFWQFIIIGFVASIMCVLGDIFESYLKRKAKVKDSGDILPGHGGILDRMDSHIFCAPIVFLFLMILL